MKSCSIDKCFNKHHAKGYCHKHYNSFLKHGNALFTDNKYFFRDFFGKCNRCKPLKIKPFNKNKSTQGYVMLRKTTKGKRIQIGEHVQIWKDIKGEIPKGYHIHHINENRMDNRIDNLICIDVQTHKRIHSGWKLINCEWWKPCTKCKTFLKANTNNFYASKKDNKLYSLCKKCNNRKKSIRK